MEDGLDLNEIGKDSLYWKRKRKKKPEGHNLSQASGSTDTYQSIPQAGK
ncbi:MAG: hypothetical protein QXT73_06855 [Candidatus Methanomethylicaceae archaeon]